MHYTPRDDKFFPLIFQRSSKRSFVLTDPAHIENNAGNPLIFPRREPIGASMKRGCRHAVVGRYGAPFPPTSDLVDLHRTRSVTWLDGSS